MSRLPEIYQRLVTSSDGNCANPAHSIQSYQDLIQKKLQSDKLAPVYQSMNDTIQALCSSKKMDEDSLHYTAELLARLNRHLDPDIPPDEKNKNTEQLELLLNNNIAYIFDPDVLNIILYSLGIAVLASLALLAVAAAITFLMANPAMSFMVVPPIFALITMGVMIQDPDYFEYKLEAIGGALGCSGWMLYVAPGLFLATAGAYVATFVTLAGIYLGAQHCATEVAFSAKNYSFKSDARTLINMSMFTQEPQNQQGDHEIVTPSYS